MSRGDSPADVQMARSIVAVVAGLVFAGCLSCHGADSARVAKLPPGVRTVATTLAIGMAVLRSN